MRRRWNLLLLVVMLFGAIAGPIAFDSAAQGAQDGGGFSGAAVLLQKGGDLAQYKYSLSEPPGWPAVQCEFNAAGSQVKIYGPGGITLSWRQYATQKVTIRRSLMQRLASGTYVTLAESVTLETILTTDAPVAATVPALTTTVPVGPDYVMAVRINWHMGTSATIEGWVKVLYTYYQPTVENSATTYPIADDCGSVFPPYVQHGVNSGTVNSTYNFTIRRYPLNVTVPIKWDGASIGTVKTDNTASATGSFKIPAAPMGPHTIQWKYGHWDVSQTFTVKPRIKIIPSDVDRDQTVNVSLRGFAANETVRIRWKKGGSWVQIAQVTTSGTGSANINVKVPKFVPDGPTPVRGDSVNASGGHAQTNAVTVSGGPFSASTIKTPTPTSTPTPTNIPATATATRSPEPTITNTATATIQATVAAPSETPSPTATGPSDASPVPMAP